MDFWLRKFLEKSVPESNPEDAEQDRQDRIEQLNAKLDKTHEWQLKDDFPLETCKCEDSSKSGSVAWTGKIKCDHGEYRREYIMKSNRLHFLFVNLSILLSDQAKRNRVTYVSF